MAWPRVQLKWSRILSESAVKVARMSTKRCWYISQLHWRQESRQHNCSWVAPVQASRPKPQLQQNIYQYKRNVQQRQKEHYDQHTKPLSNLRLGDRVRVQDPVTKLWSLGATVKQLIAPRSYLLHADNGAKMHRNRQHIRLFNGLLSPRTTVQLYEDRDEQSSPEAPTFLFLPRTKNELPPSPALSSPHLPFPFFSAPPP